MTTAEQRWDARRKRLLESAWKAQISRAFGKVQPGTLETLNKVKKDLGMSMDVLLYRLARKELIRGHHGV